jgi:(1->4)-alpha-D-glucan 1-alpha-D-glucosylmutase
MSLVDPDNRRAVDYELRRRLLTETAGLPAAGAMARADEGVPKLWLIARLLARRRDAPELFASPLYTPIEAAGTKAHHVVAFARDRLLVVVPRLLAGLGGAWGDTTLELPDGEWEDVLSEARVEGGRQVELAGLLHTFPAAVLARS